MRGLKSDPAPALYLAEKADAGKGGGRSKMVSLFTLIIFNSILFSCTDSGCKYCILTALITGAQHVSQTKSMER